MAREGRDAGDWALAPRTVLSHQTLGTQGQPKACRDVRGGPFQEQTVWAAQALEDAPPVETVRRGR